jgi:hypothetical protein
MICPPTLHRSIDFITLFDFSNPVLFDVHPKGYITSDMLLIL